MHNKNSNVEELALLAKKILSGQGLPADKLKFIVVVGTACLDHELLLRNVSQRSGIPITELEKILNEPTET